MNMPSFFRRGRTRDPQQALSEAILGLAGPEAVFVRISSKPWSSATFTGRKFRMELRIGGEDCAARATALGRTLADHDFAIAGQIVANIEVEGPAIGTDARGAAFATLTLLVLTVEDW